MVQGAGEQRGSSGCARESSDCGKAEGAKHQDPTCNNHKRASIHRMHCRPRPKRPCYCRRTIPITSAHVHDTASSLRYQCRELSAQAHARVDVSVVVDRLHRHSIEHGCFLGEPAAGNAVKRLHVVLGVIELAELGKLRLPVDIAPEVGCAYRRLLLGCILLLLLVQY
jgi:hypothetical protein